MAEQVLQVYSQRTHELIKRAYPSWQREQTVADEQTAQPGGQRTGDPTIMVEAMVMAGLLTQLPLASSEYPITHTIQAEPDEHAWQLSGQAAHVLPLRKYWKLQLVHPLAVQATQLLEQETQAEELKKLPVTQVQVAPSNV